jgi:hypothetical protein
VLGRSCENWSIVCSCASCTTLKRCDVCFTNDVVREVSSTSEEARNKDSYPETRAVGFPVRVARESAVRVRQSLEFFVDEFEDFWTCAAVVVLVFIIADP